MKKNAIIILAIAALAVACNSNAQTNASLFNANEFSMRFAVNNPAELGGTSQYDFQAKSLAGFELGAAYFITKTLGIEANVPVWRSDNRCFQSVSAGAIYRYPLDLVFSQKIWSHISPYVRAGMSYAECWTSSWSAYAGAGVEVRINKRIGVFGEIDYSRRGVFAPDAWNVVTPTAGLRFTF